MCSQKLLQCRINMRKRRRRYYLSLLIWRKVSLSFLQNEVLHHQVIDLEAACAEERSNLEKVLGTIQFHWYLSVILPIFYIQSQHELKQSENDNENLKQEAFLLKQVRQCSRIYCAAICLVQTQNLETSVEQALSTEKRLTIELAHTKEFSEAQLAQLKV